MAVKIEGIQGVVDEIKSITDDKMKRREIIKILRRQSKGLLRAIKQNTPVAEKVTSVRGVKYEPENLKKSMAIKTSPNKEYPNVLVGPRKSRKGRSNIKHDGFYAFWIQYGTIHQKPNDFIWKAARPLLGSINNVMSADLKKYIEKKIKETQL